MWLAPDLNRPTLHLLVRSGRQASPPIFNPSRRALDCDGLIRQKLGTLLNNDWHGPHKFYGRWTLQGDFLGYKHPS